MTPHRHSRTHSHTHGHAHEHSHVHTAALEDASEEKRAVARKSTLASMATTIVLMALQISVGLAAHSQALVADGAHSLADLVSDAIVLLACKASSEKPDADHNYGHSRYETVASLFLGALLIAVGVGMLVRAGSRLADLSAAPAVGASALAVALLVVVSKELLFRHMLREAKRVRSAMLIANAWHARSDAASSLVVSLGVLGSLAGFRLLDPIAAAIVGFLIARMGWEFGWNALQDLSDRALDEQASEEIRQILRDTEGVFDVHEMRTRKMGDHALVDAHILVDPMISVSEGHHIADAARARLLADPRVLDALIHVDPENDDIAPLPARLPSRASVLALAESELARHGLSPAAVTLHYLSTGLDVEIVLGAGKTPGGEPGGERSPLTALAPAPMGSTEIESLKTRLGARRLRVLAELGASDAA
jgi:cation diffusion facilitator family transporter